MFRTAFFRILVLAGGVFWFGGAQGASSAERAALEALYTNLNGPNWRMTVRWDINAPLGEECFWEGVLCDEGLSQVISLRLSGRGLRGTLPPEIGNLVYLEVLDLSGNDISGPLPSEVGQLTRLTELYLDFNDFTGPIPSQLGQLTNLVALGLQVNRFEGEIPSTLGNLVRLEWLDLEGNQLTGEIPSTLVNLTHLADLFLNYNALVSTNADVIAFLEGVPEGGTEPRSPDWQVHQTRAPQNLRVDWRSATSITLAWDPVPIPGFFVTGGYQVWYGMDPNGPWEQDGGSVDDLNADRLTISNLAPETTYYFIIRTWSDPHDGNSSTLWSYRAPDAGSDLVATTLAAVDPDPDPDTDGDGIPDGADADLCQPTAMNLVADISYQGQGNTRLQSTEGVQVQGDGKVEVIDAHELIVEAPYFLVTLGTEFGVEAGSQMRVIPAEPSCQ